MLHLGEYYFNLFTYSSKGDTVKSRTYVTVDSNSIKPFNIKTDHAAWIDSAIIYEITPYNFTENGKFDFIKTKIPELAELGVTTIWLQPVYKTYYGGQGYDITNYFEVRNDLGTEQQLKSLIQRAKAYGLRVLFDFVANHSSIQHPYAVESSQLDEQSHYYNFYQREEDNAPYSQHYHHYNGFINYFWDDLPNLNYDNPEVRKWITEAAKYWIKNYDIDGYRFDAIWGVNARDPQFAKDLRLELKRIKPEILMLAEDKATRASVFDERFDAAFDWAPGEDWVSQWVWSYDYSATSNPTIFNSGGVNNRSEMLRNSLTNNGNGYASNAKILRFMENNDTFHFITHHNLAQTKMVAALMFSLNGIPLLYNGQEIGITGHPYSIDATFQTGESIQSQDKYGLFNYYKRLAELRTLLPSLRSENFEETSISPNKYIYAYRRWSNNQNVFCAINMSGAITNAELTIPINDLNLDSSKTYYLTDMINGEIISGKPEELSTVNMTIDGYTTRMFLLADTTMTVTSVNDDYTANAPQKFELKQNYPNPFNPTTTINFVLPKSSNITLKVYNSIGEEVMSLLNGFTQQGIHSIRFNGRNLSSGVYFYQLRYNNNVITKKMMLLK